MLVMVVSTHSTEACPMVNPKSAEVMISAAQRMNDTAKTLGIKILGAWNDMPAHTTFMLVDAPKPEALNKMAMDLHFIDWTTSISHPVVTMEESIAILQQQKKK